MEWRDLFEKRILERGFEYYKRGLVTDFLCETDCIEATVQGSDAYDVTIDLEDGEIIDIECDCPYAQEENLCKHMAAVLFYVEEEKAGLETPDSAGAAARKREAAQEESAGDMVKRADEALVRSFLTKLLEADERLFLQFKRVLGGVLSPEDLRRCKKRIDAIFREYAGWDQYIEYQQAGPFAMEIEAALEEDVAFLVDARQYQEAFALTSHVFKALGRLDADDSSGEISMLDGLCMDIWRRILEQCDLPLKRKMFQWYMKQLGDTFIDYRQDCIEEMLFESELFQEDEFLAEKYRYTKERAHRYASEKDAWARDHQAGKWMLRHVDVLRAQGVPQDKIEAYCKAGVEYSVVRKYYVAAQIEAKRYDEAIRVLEESKAAHWMKWNAAEERRQLKRLYKETGKQAAYEKELWALLLQYEKGDLEIYRELKALYTQEAWQEKREAVFQSLSPQNGLDRLYEEEGLYDRLLQIVLESDGLYKLEAYEACLRALYPKQLLHKYEQVVQELAEQTSNRGQYQELVSILKRMQTYPQGAEKVEEIAAQWRKLYRRRRAMMEELGKL